MCAADHLRVADRNFGLREVGIILFDPFQLLAGRCQPFGDRNGSQHFRGMDQLRQPDFGVTGGEDEGGEEFRRCVAVFVNFAVLSAALAMDQPPVFGENPVRFGKRLRRNRVRR